MKKYISVEKNLNGTYSVNPSSPGADLEANKAATIDVSTYTEPVEITPTQGKDGMAKATVTLTNIPSGDFVPFGCLVSGYDDVQLVIAPLGAEIVGALNSQREIIGIDECFNSDSYPITEPSVDSASSDPTVLNFYSVNVTEYNYVPYPLSSEDNPASLGLYEYDGNNFVLTIDTEVVEGKTYYEYASHFNYALQLSNGDLYGVTNAGIVTKVE